MTRPGMDGKTDPVKTASEAMKASDRQQSPKNPTVPTRNVQAAGAPSQPSQRIAATAFASRYADSAPSLPAHLLNAIEQTLAYYGLMESLKPVTLSGLNWSGWTAGAGAGDVLFRVL